MAKNIHILASHHLEHDRSLRLGGLDVYIRDLATLLSEEGYIVFVHELSPFSSFNFLNEKGYRNIGYYCKNSESASKKSNRRLINLVKNSNYYRNNDLIIFSTDYLSYGTSENNSIAIQHGIAWDVPFNKKSIKNLLKRFFLFERKKSILQSVSKMVCVDYNYLNWFKANYSFQPLLEKVFTIPNYAVLPLAYEKNINNPVNICFSRRFWKPRGTDILIGAIEDLSKKSFFKNIRFYISGSGNEENTLRQHLSHFQNVIFEKYESGNGVMYHMNKDIALIPTSGSEGTSLSALEAMAAKCAVICTAVGGLSNIVIDGYNGLIIRPNGKDLARAIESLVLNLDKRRFLQEKAYETIKYGFSKEKWNRAWISLIRSMEEIND